MFEASYTSSFKAVHMYKKWLIKVSILFALSLVAVSILYKFIVIDRVYSNIDYAIAAETKNVFIGASHFEVGIDDALLNDTANYSVSGMPYYFTYPKVKRILENNKQIEKLFVSLSPIHIGPYGDATLLSDKGLSREEAFEFFPLMEEYDALGAKRFSLDFVLSYAKYNLGVPFNYMDDLKRTLVSFKRHLSVSDFDFMGKYKVYTENLIKPADLKKKADFYFGDHIQYSEFTVKAVEKVAALAQQLNVELYIVNMPAYEEFRKLVPSEYTDKQKSLMQDLQAKYTNLRYLDYYEYPIDAKGFLDGDHLNIVGAKVFTQELLNKAL